jgi:hypothetical protein
MTAPVGPDPNRLDQGPLSTMSSQSGDVGDLHAGNNVSVIIRDDQHMARIRVDVSERPFVGLIDHGKVAGLAQHIISKQGDDRPGQIGMDSLRGRSRSDPTGRSKHPTTRHFGTTPGRQTTSVIAHNLHRISGWRIRCT